MTKLELRPLFEEPALPKEVPREPTRVVVSLSGGKDSVASLLVALEIFGAELLVAHHQVVLEDFVGTVEYCQNVCHFIGVPLSFSQGIYNSFLCLGCGHKHLSIFFEEAYCHKCGSRNKQFLGMVRGIHDYIRHRGKWMGGTVRPCTKNFKMEVWNAWARENEGFLGPKPILVLGERRLESKNRRDLPELRYRDAFRKGWVLEWRPVLHYQRIDAFRKLREYGVEPHPCYRLQWRALLHRRHRRWREEGLEPRTEYPGQWHGLYQVEHLSDRLLDPMIDTLMLDIDSEGGPSC